MKKFRVIITIISFFFLLWLFSDNKKDRLKTTYNDSGSEYFYDSSSDYSSDESYIKDNDFIEGVNLVLRCLSIR